jgi:hypothetical protein
MKFGIAPDSRRNVFELAVLAAASAGLTVIGAHIAELDIGSWAALVSSGITIALSFIRSIESR